MEQATVTTNRRLQRGDGPIAGVAAGMADYFGIDPVIVRLGLVATTVLGGPTVPIVYLAAWLIIPAAEAPETAPVHPAAPWSAAQPPQPPVPTPQTPAPASAPVPTPATSAPTAGGTDTMLDDAELDDTELDDTMVHDTAVDDTPTVAPGAAETSDTTDEDER